jgi:uncharacterized protein (DUF305 family)
MKRLPILVVTLIVVVVAATATAVGVVLANRGDHPLVGTGPGMMDRGSSSAPGWWDDSWDSMMTGPMMVGSYATASEAEYLVEMVAHHREAVAAARELARSDRPEMRAFGQSIVESQSAQIEQMTAWLADWYPEQSTTVDYRPMMRGLSGLSGDRLDRAFLQDMIGHHMVAVMMSQHLLVRGTDHEEVAYLARSIRDDQHAEIIQMQRWLAQWFDAGWGGMGRGMGPGMMSGSRS